MSPIASSLVLAMPKVLGQVGAETLPIVEPRNDTCLRRDNGAMHGAEMPWKVKAAVAILAMLTAWTTPAAGPNSAMRMRMNSSLQVSAKTLAGRLLAFTVALKHNRRLDLNEREAKCRTSLKLEALSGEKRCLLSRPQRGRTHQGSL